MMASPNRSILRKIYIVQEFFFAHSICMIAGSYLKWYS